MTIVGNVETRVTEALSYIAPEQANSRYITERFVDGQPDVLTVYCGDTIVVVTDQVRYEFCADDATFEETEWQNRSVPSDWLQTPFAQPWRRLAWIKKVTRDTDVVEHVAGVKTRVYAGVIDRVQEANTRWPNVQSNTGDLDEWDQFVSTANISVKAWVRETDGLIARFKMNSVYTRANGQTETSEIDYTFSDFNSIGPIAAPDTSTKPGFDEEGEAVVASVQSGQQAAAGGQQTAAGDQQTGQPATGATAPEGAVGLETNQVGVINGQTLNLEIADTDTTRSVALGGRESLPDDSAMLVAYESEEPQTYWMKDVLIPLDIVSLDGNFKVVDITTMQPQPQIPDFALRRYLTPHPRKICPADERRPGPGAGHPTGNWAGARPGRLSGPGPVNGHLGRLSGPSPVNGHLGRLSGPGSVNGYLGWLILVRGALCPDGRLYRGDHQRAELQAGAGRYGGQAAARSCRQGEPARRRWDALRLRHR